MVSAMSPRIVKRCEWAARGVRAWGFHPSLRLDIYEAVNPRD